ncbi:MAG: orotidine-5'-phosphate decarboxylase [Gammaproteobacteria bacterium]|nr:orotidine-5'-phosphate decarboxylase [Gammaproteobacteria bacterium]
MGPFIETLTHRWRSSGSLLCVGLDPDADKLPPSLRTQRAPLLAFNRAIIDATAQWACAFKVQIAHYAAIGAERQLERTIAYIKRRYADTPVILDAKRGDIGATARMYAREAFERYQADAVTVNPYLGGDALAPFLEYADNGVFVLCRTSNPGSGEFQRLSSGGRTVAQHVAARAAGEWNGNRNVGLVVGATWPREIGAIRRLAGDLPLLIPGIGTQGGDLEAVLKNGLVAGGAGLIINISRGIIYAGAQDEDFAGAAGRAAQAWCGEINRHRGEAEAGR